MQSSSGDFINPTNEVGTSGGFLKLARNGQLVTVSSLIQKRAKVAENLIPVEAQLVACNHPTALVEFALWCLKRRKQFAVELPRKVQSLEVRKIQLRTEVERIDQLLAQDESSFEWTTDSGPMTSLVPRVIRKTDPCVAERNEVIDCNLNLPDQEICRVLDRNFTREGQGCDYVLKSWVSRYGVRTFIEAYRHPECRKKVHKLISVRRRVCSYPKA